MKNVLIVMAMLALCMALPGTHPGEGVSRAEPQDSPSLRTGTLDRVEATRIMHLLADGRPDSALAILTGPDANTNDPFVLLLRVRSMREMISDEDDDKELVKNDVNPMDALLDRAIELCDDAIDRSSDPIYYYYRGRAWLGKAQLRTLTRSYWGAGRCAKKAKNDLEKFLEYHPDNPDAQGDLGAFLYFADTLPGFMKFVSKLLFMPTGDRDRGLQMLEYAASHEGVFQTDYQIALGAINIVFEGRFEEGADIWLPLIERYPHYFRLVEPLGIISPLYPSRIAEFEEIERKARERLFNREGGYINHNLVKAIEYHRAFVKMYFGAPRQAAEELSALAKDPPQRPDWVRPLIILNRGTLHKKAGHYDEAIAAYEYVKDRDDMEHFHDIAGQLLESVEDPPPVIDLAELDFVAAIYDGRLDEAEVGLRQLASTHGLDVIYHFYSGEISLLRRNFAEAQRAYEQALELEAKGGDQTYQMFAGLRLSEIHGQEGRYGEAKEYIDRALGYKHCEYLVDMMIHSRKRFYDLLENGTIQKAPSMLVGRTGGSASPTQPANR